MTALQPVHTENRSPSARVRDTRSALATAAAMIGAERVTGPGSARQSVGPNVSLFGQREIAGVIRPSTAAEVRLVVAAFGGPANSGQLYPVSTGRNWGLGSREPARDGAVVLDLSGLDRVRAVDTEAGWAVIEPGVTQGQLARQLMGTSRTLNLTASSMHTSVIGNALDRGVGLRRQRVEDLAGLEVVLPGGELIRVGWWPSGDRATPVYPEGLGPSALQLFVQSNLGVVTAAAVRLPPRPEALSVVRMNFRPENLRPAMDELRRWVAQGLTRGVPKVYDPNAAKSYHGTEGEFLVHVCVDGTVAAVEALTRVITDEAVASGLFTQVSHTDRADADEAVRKVATLVEVGYAGEPDAEDALFRAKMRVPADEVDAEAGGFLFFLPLVPFTGEAIARADEIVTEVSRDTGVRCGETLNVLGPDVVDFVVALRFAPQDARKAHRVLDRLHQHFTAEGFLPYRLDVDHSDWIDRLSPDPAARRFVRRLKEILDPDDVFAPGRYS
jgi:4-cresol dehydrogenase (hydroxylating) flavoprotein subunit